MAAAKPGGVDHQAVAKTHNDPADDEEEEEILEDRDRATPRQAIELESLPERFDDTLRDGGEQDHEAPEDEGVEHAGKRPAQQASLRDDVHEKGAEARAEMIETPLPPRRAAHLAEQLAPAQSARDQRRTGE